MASLRGSVQSPARNGASGCSFLWLSVFTPYYGRSRQNFARNFYNDWGTSPVTDAAPLATFRSIEHTLYPTAPGPIENRFAFALLGAKLMRN